MNRSWYQIEITDFQESISLTRGGNREPVLTQNRFQLTNSIGIVCLQRYWFFLTLLSFPCLHKFFRFFSWNFVSRYICVTFSAKTQTFNCEAASWRGGSDLKPGCISPNKMRILPCVLKAMLLYRVRAPKYLYTGGRTKLFRLYFLSTLYLVEMLFSMFELNMLVFTVLCRHNFGKK